MEHGGGDGVTSEGVTREGNARDDGRWRAFGVLGGAALFSSHSATCSTSRAQVSRIEIGEGIRPLQGA